MVSMRAFSPDRGIHYPLLTNLPSRIITPLAALAILCALLGHPVPVLESGRGRC